MKKLSILCLAAALSFSALTAEFGVGVFTSTDGLSNGIQTGIGATYEKDYLFSSFGYSTGSSETDNGTTKTDSRLSGFSVSAAYKLPLSAENTVLFGVRYTSLTGEVNEADIEAASKLALTAGVKTALNSSVSLLAEIDVYSSTVYEQEAPAPTKNETTGSNFLNGGRLGVTLTF